MDPAGRPARWLALGDSYTIGEGVEESERWPSVVTAELRLEGLALAVPRVLARTGWTTDELLAAMEREGAWPPGERFALVSLMVGVNDQYRGHTLEAFAAGFAACLERAIALAGGEGARVLVVSIPDWGAAPFAAGRDRAAISRSIDAFNARALGMAGERGAHWGDVTALSRAHGANADQFAADGLHPGAPAHGEWARALVPLARAALAGRAPSQL